MLVQNWAMNSGHSMAQRASVFTLLAVVWSLLRAASYALLLMAIIAGRTGTK
jgi:inner membrane protein involved in colicin E2 resistance